MSAVILEPGLRTQIEAAAFRQLVAHLRARSDVQNLDLMNLAGFCRNCLSRWYREAASEHGVEIADPDAREIIYGMPYKAWQAQHQRPAGEADKPVDAGHHAAARDHEAGT
jgi:hypothetical protein